MKRRKISNLSLFFGGLLIGFSIYFLIWGIGFIGHHSYLVFVLSSLFGIFMAFNIGGNDVANSFGTSVGAGTLTIKQALCIAAIFEVSGAIIAGGEVTDTIRNKIVNLDGYGLSPDDLICIMMSALISAGLWLLLATKKGWPVSTTHSIIGGILGASLTYGIIAQGFSVHSFDMVKWNTIGSIAISWIISPLLGGVVSFAIYYCIKRYILRYNQIAQIKIDRLKRDKKAFKKEHKKSFEAMSEIQKVAYNEAMDRDERTLKEEDVNPDELESEYYKKIHEFDTRKEKLKTHKALEVGVPLVAAFGAVMISFMLIFKGLKNLHLNLSLFENILIVAMIGAVVWIGTYTLAKTLRRDNLDKSTFFMFSGLQVFTAAGFAFSHGSNDIANAVGPFAAIIDALASGVINPSSPIEPMVMITFAVALISGLWFIGREVIETVGTHLTKLHPASGFSAELSAASVVMIASLLGLPVSSTHILIGAVLGVGIVNKSANWGLMKPITLAWVITIPASFVIASAGFLIFRNIF